MRRPRRHASGGQGSVEVIYLPRHGATVGVAPHRINYRANIWRAAGSSAGGVIGINTVGGIAPAARPGRVVLPHQLIDYT